MYIIYLYIYIYIYIHTYIHIYIYIIYYIYAHFLQTTSVCQSIGSCTVTPMLLASVSGECSKEAKRQAGFVDACERRWGLISSAVDNS